MKFWRHKSNWKKWLVAMSCVILLLATNAFAQNTGSVVGTVTDATGSQVVSAHVTAQSHTENIVRSAVTSETGSFILSELPIGEYTVRVEARGFEKFANVAVRVDADQNVTVNARLQVGEVSQEITVSSAPSQIDTHSDTTSQIIPEEIVSDLPNSTGQAFEYLSVLPGVTNISDAAAFTGDRSGPTFSVSGSRSSDNLLLLDGLMHANFFRNTGQNYPPPPFLAQVEVLVGNYGAQYGHNTGGIMNVLTKSGTNQFHGQAWEYDQNTAFNAANYYTGAVAPLHLNRFGGELGGPILKNGPYFFAAYEGYRQSKVSTASSAIPPTAGEIAGNFAANAAVANKSASSYLNNPNYAKGKYYSTLSALLSPGCAAALGTGQYIATSQIPASCLNPVVQALDKKYIPVNPSGPNAPFSENYSSPTDNDVAEGRLDWQFRNHTIDGRYIILDSSTIGYTTSTNALPLYEALNQSASTKTIALNDTWVVSPNLLNFLRMGYNRFFSTATPTDTTSLNSLGSAFPVLGRPVLPAITVSSRMALSSTSTDLQRDVNEDLDFLDSVGLTRGNHSIQAGAEYLRLQYMNRSYFYTMGQFTFNGAFTGDAMADYMFGFVQSATAESPQIEQTGIQHNLYLWAQDDWKVLPRLTLNLGLRYELPLPWYQPQNWWSTFRPGQQSSVIPSAPVGLVFPGDSGVLRGEVPTPHFDFAPRIGFAYDLFGGGRTAIRGGVGLFYDAVGANVIENNTEPFVYQFSPNVTPASISNPYASGPAFPTTVSLSNPAFILPLTLTYPDQNLRTPYVEAANLNIQHQILTNLAVQVGYVGKFGRHQLLDFNSNPALYAAGATATTASYQARRAYSNFGNLSDMATAGTSSYNALQAAVTKRMAGWLSAEGSYSWSRSLDEYSSTTTDTATIPNVFNVSAVPATGSPLVFKFRSEYGPSDFNAAHVAGLGYTVYAPKFENKGLLFREFVGGWNLSGRYNIRSGTPVNMTSSTDWALTNSPR